MTTPTNKTPLECALALVEIPKDATSGEVWDAYEAMDTHCLQGETMDDAAARILASEYRRARTCIEAIKAAYDEGNEFYPDHIERMGELAEKYLNENNSQKP